ncbi:MAG TPA: HAD family hydrolase [Dehalococcoidia bacterium]|nr:HAD family hydrolase [Dehalococcoidia bacterium]
MPRVFLFDIDNTLLYTGGAGSLAMAHAFEELYGVPNGFSGIEFSGRTDRWILQTGLDNHGIGGGCEAHLEEFTTLYYALLPDAMKERDGRLMPGFPQLLRALSQESGVRLGLATGNFPEAARLKLEHLGLHQYFVGGGYGEASLERADVVSAAISGVANGARPDDVFVIGDTPHDITSALDNGVVAVGVATGTYGVDKLSKSGAHLAFAHFSDWQLAAHALLTFRP